MPELHALPDATPTGALTPEELLLQHAAHLSSQRDRSQLETSFVHALRSTLGVAVSKLYRLYTPTGEGFFCAEPMSHQVNALTLDEPAALAAGLQVLAPGASTRLCVRFELP